MNEEIKKMLDACIVINGGRYCRPHIRASFHICEVEYSGLNDDANEERGCLVYGMWGTLTWTEFHRSCTLK